MQCAIRITFFSHFSPSRTPLDLCASMSEFRIIRHKVLNHNGIEPGLDKVAVLADMAPPTTAKALKSVCGLFNWFRKFIFQFARKIQPLHRLTRPYSNYKEGKPPSDALTAFYRLRAEITLRPILAYPNYIGRYHIYVDAYLGEKKNTGGVRRGTPPRAAGRLTPPYRICIAPHLQVRSQLLLHFGRMERSVLWDDPVRVSPKRTPFLSVFRP